LAFFQILAGNLRLLPFPGFSPPFSFLPFFPKKLRSFSRFSRKKLGFSWSMFFSLLFRAPLPANLHTLDVKENKGGSTMKNQCHLFCRRDYMGAGKPFLWKNGRRIAIFLPFRGEKRKNARRIPHGFEQHLGTALPKEKSTILGKNRKPLAHLKSSK